MSYRKQKYFKIIDQAVNQVPGFSKAYSQFIVRTAIDQCSSSFIESYGRNIGHAALYFGRVPHEVSIDEINMYLYQLIEKNKHSKSFFKHTIYGLRYWFRLFKMPDKALEMPAIKQKRTLPTVLSKEECKALFHAPGLLKHRFMLALAYGAGLRTNELRLLKIADIDLDRKEIHIRNGKGGKSRFVILPRIIAELLPYYLVEENPLIYLFEGLTLGCAMGARSIQYVINEALQKTEIRKAVSMHTLRHSFATHLLEDGVEIHAIQRLLGHADMRSTIIYLHVAQIRPKRIHSPLDSLYGLSRRQRFSRS